MKRIKLELVIETEYDDWVIDWIHQHKDEIIKLKMNNKKIEEYLPSEEEIERLMEWFNCMGVYIDKHPENAEVNSILEQLPISAEGKRAAIALLKPYDAFRSLSAWKTEYGGYWPSEKNGDEEE
tara:strand:- start:1101 stop:1472 length:372 start_codon:yes stop_codon:yes gene_type:complete